MNQGSTKYKKLRFPKEFYPNPPSYFTYEPNKTLLMNLREICTNKLILKSREYFYWNDGSLISTTRVEA